MRPIALFILIFCLVGNAEGAETLSSRYFHSGDGKIHVVSKSGSFNGTYRKADGTYNEAALKAINRVFGARYGDPADGLSIRFIEFLNYLADALNPGAVISVASGYRSPAYNTKLRENGKLAAKASLHQYAMAADVKIAGVSSEKAWNFVKELGFGGAGFYHGGLVHIDVGPARSWDETTSGVGTDISEDNKLIAAVTDRDIYLPGEPIAVRFIRMTAFPIGVDPKFVLEEKRGNDTWKTATSFNPASSSTADNSCPKFEDIRQMASFKWALPADMKPGRYRIKAVFCDKQWADMPSEIQTPEFEVR